jgi:SOS-response transcriptional repressor LexA
MSQKIGSVVMADAYPPKLGKQHSAILRFVYHFRQQFGYAPTLREIAQALEIPSTSMVNYYLSHLDEMNYIHRTSRASRSIRLLEAGYRAIGLEQPHNLQTEINRLLTENQMLRERCERLQQERDHLLSGSPPTLLAAPP